MARLGKLDKDGNISYAPAVYRSEHNTIHNFNKDYQLMIDMGYKPVVEDSNDITGYRTIKYIEEINDTIYIRYKIDNSEQVIKQIQTEKIAQTKINLANFLNAHPLASTAKGGVELLYSVSFDKQNQLTSVMSDYISKALPYMILNPVQDGQDVMEYMDSLDIPLLWNSRGETCEKWKYSELYQLKNEIMAYVVPIVEHQRKLEKQIMDCTTQEELKLIDISFTEELIK